MAKTTYFHKDCGGSIVGQLTGFKLVTPYIGVGFSKLTAANYQFLTEQLAPPVPESQGHLQYVCMKCLKVIGDEEVATDIIASCVICHTDLPIGQLYTTDYSPINCLACLENLKGENSDEMRKLFDLPIRYRKSLISAVFGLPVKI